MKRNTVAADLSEDEKRRPYAAYYYRGPAPVPAAVRKAIDDGPINPADALSFRDINRLLDPGYFPAETGYCTMPDKSCYAAVLTNMAGVTGVMLDW